jgi:hypothetical protein
MIMTKAEPRIIMQARIPGTANGRMALKRVIIFVPNVQHQVSPRTDGREGA